MKIRRIISLTVFLSFIFLALSGIMLFLSPRGRIANWGGWTLFGFTKDQFSAIHTTFMVLFLITGIWHIVLNWRPIVGYMKNRAKKIRVFTPESSVAMALTLLFLVGPLAGLPPFRQFLDVGVDIKDYWEETEGNPPWGHAEESTLETFCRRAVDFQRWDAEGPMVIDCDEALQALAAAGIEVEGPSQRILDIAEENGVTPEVVAEIVTGVSRLATPEEVAAGLAGGGRGMGRGQGLGRGAEGDLDHQVVGEDLETEVRFPQPASGLGRMTLRGYAQDYDLEVEELVTILARRGMEVNPDTRLSILAADLGIAPADIIDALNAGG
jgi:hypothetical protein